MIIVRASWIILSVMVAAISASVSPSKVFQLPWPTAWNGLIGLSWVILSVWVFTGMSPLKAIEKIVSYKRKKKG